MTGPEAPRDSIRGVSCGETGCKLEFMGVRAGIMAGVSGATGQSYGSGGGPSRNIEDREVSGFGGSFTSSPRHNAIHLKYQGKVRQLRSLQAQPVHQDWNSLSTVHILWADHKDPATR